MSSSRFLRVHAPRDLGTRRPPQNPFTGIRGTIFAGFALVSGAVILGFGGPWPLWARLFALALILAFRRT